MDIEGLHPAPDQIEVTLIGPGYGECAVVHIGSGKWVVIDSCLDSSSSQPAALSYLESLGLQPEDAIALIVATHWHDDHIRGMADLLARCPNSEFCSSAAWGREEFMAMVSAYNKRLFSEATSGVREVHEVFEILRQRGRTPIAAVSDRPVYFLPSAASGHGHECRVTTLSPSDAQIAKFHYEISALIPEIKKTKQRCTPQGPNHIAVVTWIEAGPVAVLLGSDLEETGDPETGWSVIVSSAKRPKGKATIFKVAHHGSANGHNHDVWGQMLHPAPFAVLTPNNRGKKLPQDSDVQRITELTDQAYSTARLMPLRARRRSQAVEKTLREANISVVQAEPPTGLVRLRNGGSSAFGDWKVELIRGACPLDEVHGAH